MRISQVGLAGIAIMGMSVVAPVSAMACAETTAPDRGYSGGRIFAPSDYRANPKNLCLTIAQYTHSSSGQYLWENQSMTYAQSPIAW